jgi:hypothetical protein
MDRKRRMAKWVSFVLLLALQFFGASSRTHASGPAGVVIGINLRGGQAEVRRLGRQDWQPAGPLLTLNAGDTVHVTQDTSVVVLLTGHRGSVKVDATNSPFQVPDAVPIADGSKLRKGWTLLEDSVRVLLKISYDAAQIPLGTRGRTSSLAILTPHNGFVLPDRLVFEWAGDHSARYTVRVVGPSGLVLERKDLAGPTFVYPADTAPLVPDVRYQLQVTSTADSPAKVWFGVLPAARAEAVREDLAELASVAGETMSKNTLVATQVAYLANQGLVIDARLMLMAALANDRDEAIFYYLLGDLYERLGLPDQAAESFAQARVLGRSRAER